MGSLGEQVAQASNLLGLLLALDTLFTAEQARRLEEERTRQGGARPTRLKSIRSISIGLSTVTTGAIIVLFPLFRDVIGTIGDRGWQPVLGVFELTWLLLVALATWQITIARKSS